MAYKALYRSYRPTKFSEVIGQEHVIKTLKNAISEGRTSHAYIFSGLRGIGKTTIARILAKAVNCENPINGEPCCECAACKSIGDGTSADIVEFDAASNNGVDEIRNILEKVNFLPQTLKKKVYIIDEVHMLTSSAFNALLKTLEEPPTYVMFIMATTEPHKVPLTILSRCQRFDFKQLTINELTNQIKDISKKEGINISDEAATAIAEVADGGSRDALSVLDQAATYSKDEITIDDINNITGNINNNYLIKLVTACNNKDASTALDVCNELINGGKEVSRLITCVIEFCRDILLYKSLNELPSTKNIFKNADFVTLADSIKESNLFYYIDVLNDTQNKLRFTTSQKIYLEVGIMRIVNLTDVDVDILNRIKSLEEQTQSGSFSQNGGGDYSSYFATFDSKLKKINSDISSLYENSNTDELNSRLNMIEQEIQNIKSRPVSNGDTFVDSSVYDRLDEIENSISEINTSAPQFSSIDLSEVMDKINGLNSRIENIVQSNSTTQNNPRLEALENEIKDLESKLSSLSISDTTSEVRTSSSSEADINELRAIIEGVAVKVESIIAGNHHSSQSGEIDLTDVYERLDNLETSQGATSSVNSTIMDKELDEIRAELALVRQILVTRSELEQVLKELEKINESIKDLESRKDNSQQRPISMFDFEEESDKPEEEQQQVEETPTLEVNEETESEPSIDSSVEPVVFEEEHQEEVSLEEEQPVNTVVETVESNNDQTQNQEVAQITRRRDPFTEPIGPAVPASENETDITAQVYDAKLLSNTLNEARQPNLIGKREEIQNNWNHLTDRVSEELYAPASILKNSKFRAVGVNIIIVSLPTAELCNSIMDPKNHELGKKVLYATFNYPYDFLAIPDNTWAEKREEYTSRIANGEVYPTLNPFNNPQLRIVIKKETNDAEAERTRALSQFFSDEQ